jgi:hypothetical protein
VFGSRALATASREFGDVIAAAAGPRPEMLVGVEHEFRLFEDGRCVDARLLIHGLGLSQRDLDPADPFAYRMADGSVVTCDGREIEIAIPPLAVVPGFGAAAEGRAAAARRELEARLGTRYRLVGYSTHLSVSVADDQLAEVVQRFVLHYAAALMLLLDGPTGVGLLVRPRPGRLELGGAYAAGRALRTALVFATGATRACLEWPATDGAAEPPAVMARVEPARDRFGLYIDRTAFGGDLYLAGRRTLLPLSGGHDIDAQANLALAWESARAWLDTDGSGSVELAEVDAVVHGRLPLPTEHADEAEAAGDPPPVAPTAYGRALDVQTRAEFSLAPVMLTWRLAMFLVAGRRRAFASVPGAQLAGFLAALDAGRLDAPITTYLAHRSARRAMRGPEPSQSAGLWDRLAARRRLLLADPPTMARKPIVAFTHSVAVQ